MAEDNQELNWQRADEETRRKLPPGVKLVRTLRGHKGRIGHVAWSPDGRFLATPSGDRTIRLWNTATGECLRILEGHESEATRVIFDSSGAALMSEGRFREFKLWETLSGNLLETHRFYCGPVMDGHESRETCVGLGIDGFVWAVVETIERRYSYGAKYDDTIEVASKRGVIFRSNNYYAVADRLLFSPNCSWLAVSYDAHFDLWSIPSGRSLELRVEKPSIAAFQSDETQIAVGSKNGSIALFNTGEISPRHLFSVHADQVNDIAFSPTKALLASASSDGTVGICQLALL